MRARDLGIVVGRGTPGPGNAITDVGDVRVGHATIVRGDGPLRIGDGPVRTGVTVVLPHGGDLWDEPVLAGCATLNGNGEMTGLEWIREAGRLETPIAITTTHCVGAVRDALVAAGVRRHGADYGGLPVVGETWDGVLNDVGGQHVGATHVEQALAAASTGAVVEGNVGGGTGMVSFGFKGGIGTSSRVVAEAEGGYTVGVLVQANFGRRHRLLVTGVPVGERIPPEVVPLPAPAAPARAGGSVIVIVATDAPLLPDQCARLARRAPLGIARTGSAADNGSGDIILCFATGNHGLRRGPAPITQPLRMLTAEALTPLFWACVEATEEAELNALVAAQTMTGRDGHTAHRLDPGLLVTALRGHEPPSPGTPGPPPV